MEQDSKKNTALIGIIAIVIIAAAVVGTIALKPKSDSSTISSPSSSNTTSSDSSSNDTANSTTTDSATTSYKDGTYKATGDYTSPGGNEEIDVTITISGGKVTDTSVTPLAATRESMEYQDDFVSGYKQLVVGKDLSTLSLSKVSGSSLTSRGFNEALDQIRNQAKG